MSELCGLWKHQNKLLNFCYLLHSPLSLISPPPPPPLPAPILCPSPSSSTHSVIHWPSHTWQSLTLPLLLALLHILSVSCRNTNKMSLLAQLRLHLLLATCRLTSPFSSLVITYIYTPPPSLSPSPTPSIASILLWNFSCAPALLSITNKYPLPFCRPPPPFLPLNATAV